MNGQGPFQAIQSMAGGVKFGNLVVVKAQAVRAALKMRRRWATPFKVAGEPGGDAGAAGSAAAALAQSLQVPRRAARERAGQPA